MDCLSSSLFYDRVPENGRRTNDVTVSSGWAILGYGKPCEWLSFIFSGTYPLRVVLSGHERYRCGLVKGSVQVTQIAHGVMKN